MKNFLIFAVVASLLLLYFGGCTAGVTEGFSDIEEGDKINNTNPEDPYTIPDQPFPMFKQASFLRVKMVSESEIHFEFSSPVRVISISFEPALSIDSIEDGKTVKVFLKETPEPFLYIMADLLVEDEGENVFSMQAQFRSRNMNIPELYINELRTEFTSPNRAEFIEFYIKTAGNLGGLRVFAAGNYKNPMIYEFSPVEVKEGQYVVLHLRSFSDLCVDEYGPDLGASGGNDSSPNARDFWIPGATELLRKTDAVYVLDEVDRALTAVMISETPDLFWKKDYFEKAAEFLFNEGVWESPAGGICTPLDAVSSAKIKSSSTRSISRDETVADSHTALDWYVTQNYGATPGLPNDPIRFD